MSTTVLVTGGAGFIASHIVGALLTKGYTVIGTSRTLEKCKKTAKLFEENFPQGKVFFVAVPDINASDAFDEILKTHSEITQVIHTATAIDLTIPKEQFEEKVVNVAVNSTINILTSIQKFAPQVKNLVITGSAVSITAVPISDPASPVTTFTNKDWNPIELGDITEDPMTAYIVSKKYAEKASIKYIEENKPQFNIMTINPTYVIGPQAFDEYPINIKNLFLINSAKKSSNKFISYFNDFSVDVRDVANFHILAMENGEKCNGFRFLLGDQHFYDQRVIDTVVKNVPEATLEFTGELNAKAPQPKYYVQYQDSVDEVGGYDFVPFEQTVTDTFKQYVKVNRKL